MPPSSLPEFLNELQKRVHGDLRTDEYLATDVQGWEPPEGWDDGWEVGSGWGDGEVISYDDFDDAPLPLAMPVEMGTLLDEE